MRFLKCQRSKIGAYFSAIKMVDLFFSTALLLLAFMNFIVSGLLIHDFQLLGHTCENFPVSFTFLCLWCDWGVEIFYYVILMPASWDFPITVYIQLFMIRLNFRDNWCYTRVLNDCKIKKKLSFYFSFLYMHKKDVRTNHMVLVNNSQQKIIDTWKARYEKNTKNLHIS